MHHGGGCAGTAVRGSEWAERNLELSAHRKGGGAGRLATSPTQSDTAHAGGGMAGNVRMGDMGGIPPAFLRREDVERKNAMV